MTTTKSYDFLNRLTQISSAPSGSSVVNFTYRYNLANQRTRSTLADGSYWLYEYDSLGQVKSGRKYWSDQTPVAGQQFEYGFDDIGNRKSTKAGGDQNGGNLRSATYTPNNLNQYSQRDVPGYVDIMGLSFATNTVTVTGTVDAGPNSNKWYHTTAECRGVSALASQADGTFSLPGVPLYPGTNALVVTVTDVSGNWTQEVRHVFKTTTNVLETFAYDGNGNVTALINAKQIVVGRASYDAFGRFLTLSGPAAVVNVYWFSSKPLHGLSGKYDFLRRWYDPGIQRFLNRDPIQEFGGINLYRFVANNPIDKVDIFGLTDYIVTDKWLNAEYQQQYKRLKYHETWQTYVPVIGEAYFDTTFFNATRNDTFTYNGVKYTGGEINYIGIGMYEANSGDSLQTALFWTYLWKELKWFPWTHQPNENELYWLEQGYQAYLQRNRCDQVILISTPSSFGITHNTPTLYLPP